MPDYWLDSNVFIEGRKGPYGFDIAPRFWAVIDEMVAVGRVSSSTLVYHELADVQDELAEWAGERRTSGIFVEPDTLVQAGFQQIVEYVNSHYTNVNQVARFLDKADPWVIAQAVADGSAVVTLETEVPANSQKVKIPNVCNQFNARHINTYQMLRELGVSWNA